MRRVERGPVAEGRDGGDEEYVWAARREEAEVCEVVDTLYLPGEGGKSVVEVDLGLRQYRRDSWHWI